MKKNLLIASLLLTSLTISAQVSPAKSSPAKPGMYPDFVEYNENNAPNHNGAPYFGETSTTAKTGNPSSAKAVRTEKGKSDETYKYQQHINDIPVEFGILNVHVKGGKIVSQNGNWFKDVTKAAADKGSISESVALNRALSYVGAKSYKWQDPEEEDFIKKESGNQQATFAPKGTLVYYSDPSNLDASTLKLAYKFDIYAAEPLSRKIVYVDAKTGSVLGHNDLIHETNAPGTAVTAYSGTQSITTDSYNGSYRLRETGRGNGIQTFNMKKSTNYAKAVDFTDTDNNWNNVNTTQDQYATDAHWGAEKTYDFYFTKFGRNSIDNKGFAIKNYVHFDRNYFNAFWDGSRMTYGDGSTTYVAKPLTAIDVCGHEITHGLTSFTANLNYNNESGALNEGFSDIFGNSIEAYARPTKNSWLIGEDFYTIRSMSNPNAYSQPDTYKGTNWYTGTSDSGGVHTNSGVLNYWYYLLTVGGSGTNDKGFAYSVSGIGIDKAAAIAYRTLTTYLVPTSVYADARTYSIKAASDLYGATSNEVTQVTNAWNAVGVGGGTSAAGVVASTGTSTAKFAIGPNPATDKFTLSFEDTQSATNTVELVSMTGKKEVSTSFKSTNGSNKVEISIPATATSGVYIVLVNGQKAGTLLKK